MARIWFTFAEGMLRFNAGGSIVEAAMREAAPKRTGAFARGIHWEPSPLGFKIVMPSPLGEYIVRGTRPHVIEPRNGSVLVFESGGQIVFARRVQHPGTQPNPFHKRAWNAAAPEVLTLARRSFGQAIHVDTHDDW